MKKQLGNKLSGVCLEEASQAMYSVSANTPPPQTEGHPSLGRWSIEEGRSCLFVCLLILMVCEFFTNGGGASG